MTSWQSLLYCAQADVTLQRIRNLITVTGTEPVTVEFKENATPRIADCAAAMANTHGGLIFVGVTDADREVVGVPREVIGNISGLLADRLDPAGWLTDMFEVPLGDDSPDNDHHPGQARRRAASCLRPGVLQPPVHRARSHARWHEAGHQG